MRTPSPPPAGLPSRIRLLTDLSGGTGKLAAAVGWPQRTIQRYANGTTVPPRHKLLQIALTTGCDIGWLANGTGTAPADAYEVLAAIRRATQSIEEDWYPVISLPGEKSPCPIHYASQAWIESIQGKLTSAEPLGSMRVKDASMAPIFLPGDLVLVAPINSYEDAEIVLWKDYAIRAYGEWYIRRKTPHGWDAITQGAVSFPFDKERVEVYGRVFAKVQAL